MHTDSDDIDYYGGFQLGIPDKGCLEAPIQQQRAFWHRIYLSCAESERQQVGSDAAPSQLIMCVSPVESPVLISAVNTRIQTQHCSTKVRAITPSVRQDEAWELKDKCNGHMASNGAAKQWHGWSVAQSKMAGGMLWLQTSCAPHHGVLRSLAAKRDQAADEFAEIEGA
mmetsp:Transcript_43944/g.100686  ORF Transcript_43944/g.100686 Transcript_43944/m.100686 type:complete len:169 (-) Transcript_43944:274-780(-)